MFTLNHSEKSYSLGYGGQSGVRSASRPERDICKEKS